MAGKGEGHGVWDSGQAWDAGCENWEPSHIRMYPHRRGCRGHHQGRRKALTERAVILRNKCPCWRPTRRSAWWRWRPPAMGDGSPSPQAAGVLGRVADAGQYRPWGVRGPCLPAGPFNHKKSRRSGGRRGIERRRHRRRRMGRGLGNGRLRLVRPLGYGLLTC